MALIRNGANVLTGLSRFHSATGSYGLRSVFESSGRRRGRTAGEAAVSNVTDRMSMPQGARHPIAWFMPTKAGGLASTNEAEGSSTGTLTLADGRNIAATSDGTSTSSATLQLVVSLAGTSDGASTAAGNVVASLSGAATSEGSSTGSATISAIAWAYGTSSGSCTASLVSYATGSLSGAITPYTELSPESLASSLWNSIAASYNNAGTMGQKLNAAGSGGVDYEDLAAAVWDRLESDMTASGSAGEKLKQLLTTVQFLGLK